MVRLRDETGETVHLAVLHGGTPISVARELSLQRVGVMTQIGDSWTINEGAMGLVVGAHSPEAEEGLSDELRARHRRIRDRGFSIDREEVMRGVVGIAAPVFDFRGEINGALAVAGPVDRIPVHEDDQAALAALVIAAANQISYELGWLGPDQQ
jgi:DNA-binding IclR family transcriptional regulator